MNRSTALIGQAASLTAGSAGFCGGLNAQCLVQVAPCSTHRRSTATCSGVSGLPVFFGGICRSGSWLSIRAISSLSPGLPGTIARPPLSSSANAPSWVSSRSPALRALSSGPWQAKQWSERIGRTSRAKPTGFGLASPGRALRIRRRTRARPTHRPGPGTPSRFADVMPSLPSPSRRWIFADVEARRAGPIDPPGHRPSDDQVYHPGSGAAWKSGTQVAETSRRTATHDRARLDVVGNAVPSWPDGGPSDRDPIPGRWRPVLNRPCSMHAGPGLLYPIYGRCAAFAKSV